ncbi:MAG: ATP-binding protein [Sphingobium sp.]
MIARLTIYQRIVALTAAAILLSLGAMMIVTFRGPPPVSRPLGLDDLARLLEGERPPDWRIERHKLTRFPTQSEGQMPHPAMEAQLAERLGVPVSSVRLLLQAPPGGPPGEGPGPELDPEPGRGARPGRGPGMEAVQGPFTLVIRREKAWLVLQGTQSPAILYWYSITFSLMGGVFILLMLPVRRVARTIGDPIARLAAMAEEGSELRPSSGQEDSRDAPPEIRALVSAMEGMQRRIRDQERDRAALLRAIAHDLRTPMTRLSFRVDRLPENQRERAQADIAEMRAMISAILDFMDGHSASRPTRVDAASLIEALVDSYREQGSPVDLQAEARLVVLADAALLRRAVQNVLDNALRYAGNAHVALRSDGRAAQLVIEDDGPGIAPSVIARATEPFWRGEASRARSTGGVGLGLAIVQEAMAAMHGTLSIANRPGGGGLCVVLGLPLAG